MKRYLMAVVLVILSTILLASEAHAGILEKARTWVTGEVAALVLSAILAILGGAFGLVFRRMSRTFKEAGEFMATLGIALEDKKLTRKELACIVKEGKDIFAVWR